MFCAYHIVDALTTPYESEWLTATAFVPYLITALLFYGFCAFITYWVIVCSEHRRAWLWLLPIAGFTLLPYCTLLFDPIALMGS